MPTVPIIDLFLHPPVGLLAQEALPFNPYSGLNGLTRRRNIRNVDAYGIGWNLIDIPPGYGITPKAGNNEADRTVIEIAIVHQLFDGNLVVTEQFETNRVAGYLLFQESFPYIVDVELSPGVTANLYWLLAL